MEVLRFALLGLGIGALYALASQGLLVIYRGSGVLNFAQGAIGMVGAYLYWEMKVEHGLPSPVAWIIAIAACALIGAAAHMPIMRQLKRASPLARIVATLGMLIVIQSAGRAPLRRTGDAAAVASCRRTPSTSPASTSPWTASSCWASPSC